MPIDKLDDKPGLTVVEVIKNILAGNVKGMYIMGENPAMSDPDADHAREALAKLDMLVVQDIFLTETAYLADVILPASSFAEKTGTFTNTDRFVQLGRQALNPPGKARQDLEIIIDIARQLGLSWSYGTGEPAVAAVFDEMRHTMPSIGGITWERLQKEDSVTYPCEKEGDPGDSVVFIKSFPTPTGKAKFVPADIIPADERPDTEYPMVLITGRQLEHWHTGSMTRRSGVLDAIEPDPVAMLHPLDMAALGAKPGELITIQSRRGKVSLYARADESSPHGAVFVAVLLLRSGDQQADELGARSVRQDPRVQVLRRALELGRHRRPCSRVSAAARFSNPSRQARIDLQFRQLAQGVGIRKRRSVIEYDFRAAILRGEQPGLALAAVDKGAQAVAQRRSSSGRTPAAPAVRRPRACTRSPIRASRFDQALRETCDQVGRKIRRIARHRHHVGRAAMRKTREHAGERPGKVRRSHPAKRGRPWLDRWPGCGWR